VSCKKKTKSQKRKMRIQQVKATRQKVETCRVEFASPFVGRIEECKFRHYCGGTSIKLPRDMADYRVQWVDYNYSTREVGRWSTVSVIFNK
jgi:hypothetical protein